MDHCFVHAHLSFVICHLSSVIERLAAERARRCGPFSRQPLDTSLAPGATSIAPRRQPLSPKTPVRQAQTRDPFHAPGSSTLIPENRVRKETATNPKPAEPPQA